MWIKLYDFSVKEEVVVLVRRKLIIRAALQDWTT